MTKQEMLDRYEATSAYLNNQTDEGWAKFMEFVYGTTPSVVASGNAFDGITLIGPFKDGGDAVEYAGKMCTDDEYAVVSIDPPDPVDQEEDDER